MNGLKNIRLVLFVFLALSTLISCGFQASNSSDDIAYEKTPHILDKDYRPYDRKPIEVEGSEDEDIDVDTVVDVEEPVDSSDNDVIVIGEEDDDKGVASSINHCVDTEIDSADILNSTSKNELEALKIAMYISGSFEGREGWKNLTNNFDGQGISIGLFQQNLGQGSLQPLMLKALEHDRKIFDRHFSDEQKQLLIEMLTEWVDNKGALIASRLKLALRSIASVSSYTTNKANSVRDSMSVKWSLDNLYKADGKGRKFKDGWKKALKSFAGDPIFISMQQEAAMAIHNRALGYMNTYNTKSLVSYLFFFDIVVQNGSMRGIKYASSVVGKTEMVRLQSLLSERVQLSREKYQGIVFDRKNLVLTGAGSAQGRTRYLKNETCLSDWSQIIL